MRKLLLVLAMAAVIAGCGGKDTISTASISGNGGGNGGGNGTPGAQIVIPEPATAIVFGLGLASLATGLLIKRKKK